MEFRLGLKIMCGKAIPKSDDTYLWETNLRNDFVKVSEVLKLRPKVINGLAITLEQQISTLKKALISVEKENLVFKTRIDNLQNGMNELESKIAQYGEWLTNWVEFSNYTEEEKQAIRRKLNLREYPEEEKGMMRLYLATARELEENGKVDPKKLEREFTARLKRRGKKDDFH